MAYSAVPLRETQAPPPLPQVEGGFKTILADPLGVSLTGRVRSHRSIVGWTDIPRWT